jgi:hypothetical protein
VNAVCFSRDVPTSIPWVHIPNIAVLVFLGNTGTVHYRRLVTNSHIGDRCAGYILEDCKRPLHTRVIPINHEVPGNIVARRPVARRRP